MMRSPHSSQSDKAVASGVKETIPSKETTKFKDLAKRLFDVPKEALQREIENKKDKKR